MRSYHIKYLSADQKEILSKTIDLDEIADYDVLMMHSDDYYDIKARLDKEQIKEILSL